MCGIASKVHIERCLCWLQVGAAHKARAALQAELEQSRREAEAQLAQQQTEICRLEQVTCSILIRHLPRLGGHLGRLQDSCSGVLVCSCIHKEQMVHKFVLHSRE